MNLNLKSQNSLSTENSEKWETNPNLISWKLGFPIKNFGFTLIELLIVIAILGGLATILLMRFPASQRRARDARKRSDIKQYQVAMETYAARNRGNFFVALGNLATPANCGTTLLNLTTCPDDSRGNPFNYQIRSDLTQYVLWGTLEQGNDAGATLFFVVCSDGRTADSLVNGGPVCPL
ncbi:hypothetical protein A2686_02550 [Candidatus Woesebacteria bacterium RIFCSPHIGHO2_01_FULL_38_10]|uniref:Type II secretion system protein GspG C-terminal domain-containing protein n=1 Tax=Candidatus Woesebacteria bacterium RIFCSPLOWO2_01_FULL_39_10b TaxID=1802517 RepID=A0A1F8BAR2_9BACT|nr:MAG: hypothetical protein A2686_02550 [Candidatus Woesebacteria bacterium RIFCSPHIGHO2_01_FULL_38_10]OGM60448.1 MAG: hypothetical protein A2892_00240 [Candidatus Woesebacteria bacterium RIFCSPLOWO2_01_FULL_39_10b]